MPYSRAELAARNNAAWCDAVCRAHGVAGEFHDGLWLNRHPVPRFYPNVVTLSNQDGLAQIRALSADLPGSWSIKDSFSSLNLAPLGFRSLFEAMWLWRAPSRPLQSPVVSGLRWTCIQGTSELMEWETAWNEDPTQQPSAGQPPLFLPALLADPEILFIGAYQDHRLVAGAIANHTDGVVGLSNVFVPAGDPGPFWAGCVAMVHERFPGLPLVGYESRPESAIAQQIGFELLQPLKVWIRQG